jgi:hypothetical protein
VKVLVTANDDLDQPARRLQAAARAARRLLSLLPAGGSALPYARAGADLDRLRGHVADGAAWLAEMAAEAERLADVKDMDGES